MRKTKNEELGRLSVEEYKQAAKTPIAIVLDNVRSLNNIGSVFRTADGFCVEQIYLCGITATPPNKDIHKTALGSTESVAWHYESNTLDALKKLKDEGFTLISIEQVDESISLEKFTVSSSQKYALIFGHEVNGVDQQVVDASDFCVEIPQLGTKHSFNISVSVGIVLWEFFRKIRLSS